MKLIKIYNFVGAGLRVRPRGIKMFEKAEVQGVEKITFANGTQEQVENIMEKILNRKVVIRFTTEQDIDEKANGNYRMYFQ